MNENEGVHVREVRYCLLCGCEGTLLYAGLRDRLFGAPGIWSLMRCPECQLVWLNPQPTPDDVGKLYIQYFTHQKLETPKKALAGLRKRVKASILSSSFGYKTDGSNRIMGSVLSCIAPLREIVGGRVLWLEAGEKGRLLDIGCGNGQFLDRMRQLGWEVVGVEPDGKAVSAARERYRLEVFHGSLEEAKFPDRYFDAITMNHVIEHVLEPIGLFRECRRVLRPGGTLVVVTPNVNSLGRRMFDDACANWDPPRHLFHFSTETLRASAERAELVVQDLRTTARGARWVWAASSLIKRDGMLSGGSPEAPGPSLRLQGLAFQAIEHGLCSQKGAGEELVLAATR